MNVVPSRKLKVVGVDDEPPTRLTVKEAAGTSERSLLVALRDNIAGQIDKGVPAHALAPLARQLRDLTRDLAEIDAHRDGDEIGDAASTPDEEWASS